MSETRSRSMETEKIEKVLGAFRNYIDEDDSLDIACTWKHGYILMTDGGESDSIVTAADMCKRLLHYLEGYFRETHEISFEEERLPNRYQSEFLQYAKPYMNELPEYQDLLKEYRN